MKMLKIMNRQPRRIASTAIALPAGERAAADAMVKRCEKLTAAGKSKRLVLPSDKPPEPVKAPEPPEPTFNPEAAAPADKLPGEKHHGKRAVRSALHLDRGCGCGHPRLERARRRTQCAGQVRRADRHPAKRAARTARWTRSRPRAGRGRSLGRGGCRRDHATVLYLSREGRSRRASPPKTSWSIGSFDSGRWSGLRRRSSVSALILNLAARNDMRRSSARVSADRSAARRRFMRGAARC